MIIHKSNRKSKNVSFCGFVTKNVDQAWDNVTCQRCLDMKPAPKASGIPTKYSDEILGKLSELIISGMSITQSCNILDIPSSSYYDWIKNIPGVSDKIEESKKLQVERVERSLFEMATGYQQLKTKFATNNGRITEQRDYITEHIPNIKAIEFYLTNRKPDTYKHRHENTNTEIEVKQEIIVSDEKTKENLENLKENL